MLIGGGEDLHNHGNKKTHTFLAFPIMQHIKNVRLAEKRTKNPNPTIKNQITVFTRPMSLACADKILTCLFTQDWKFCMRCPLTIQARASGKKITEFDQRVNPTCACE